MRIYLFEYSDPCDAPIQVVYANNDNDALSSFKKQAASYEVDALERSEIIMHAIDLNYGEVTKITSCGC